MSYVAVSAKRSHRFPLAGLACCSGCAASPVAGLGIDVHEIVSGASATVIPVICSLLAYGLGLHVGSRSPRENRRRRARRHN